MANDMRVSSGLPPLAPSGCDEESLLIDPDGVEWQAVEPRGHRSGECRCHRKLCDGDAWGEACDDAVTPDEDNGREVIMAGAQIEPSLRRGRRYDRRSGESLFMFLRDSVSHAGVFVTLCCCCE